MLRKAMFILSIVVAISTFRVQSIAMADLTNYGVLEIESDIVGDVINMSGGIIDFGNKVDINGNLDNRAGGTIIVYQYAIDIWSTEIQNAGLIFATFGGSLGEANIFRNSGKIRLYDGGCHGIVFHNDSNGVIEGFGRITADQEIDNKGSIKGSKGALRLLCDGSLINTGTVGNDVGATLHIGGILEQPIADVNNLGTVEIHAAGAVTFESSLTNKPNAVIKLLGGILGSTTITQKAGATFEGFGGITGNIVIEPNAIIKLTGPTNIVGDVNIAENAVLEIRDGTVLITGQTTCNGTIHLKGGQAISQGGLSGNYNIIREPSVSTIIAYISND